jgi:hypothetical protein
MPSRSIAFVLIAAVAAACTPRYTFAPPSRRAASSDAERCAAAARLEVATAQASWHESWGGGYVTADSIVISGGRIDFHHDRGAAFYRGGARLSPREAIALLPDEALRRRWAHRLDEGATRARLYRPMLGASIVMLGAGIVLSGYGWQQELDGGDGSGSLIGGITLIGTSLVPAVIALAFRRPFNVHHIRGRIYDDAAHPGELAAAVDAYNAGVDDGCGL